MSCCGVAAVVEVESLVMLVKVVAVRLRLDRRGLGLVVMGGAAVGVVGVCVVCRGGGLGWAVVPE